ncbi:MAG: CHRD domain-containing protein [Bacteroidetes bacterium]|jgi:hypothetical protein|nr:CHRD domain-containing protein [Bacteroidota bacterium]
MRKIATTLLFLLIFASYSTAQDTSYVTLAGYHEVPSLPTPATGSAEVTLVNDSLYVSGDFSDLQDPFHSAFINFGEPGETGNRIFRLDVTLNEDQKSGSFSKKDNRFKLTDALKHHLGNGHLYINISSHRHQTGEIRGQIPAMKNDE